MSNEQWVLFGLRRSSDGNQQAPTSPANACSRVAKPLDVDAIASLSMYDLPVHYQSSTLDPLGGCLFAYDGGSTIVRAVLGGWGVEVSVLCAKGSLCPTGFTTANSVKAAESLAQEIGAQP